MPREVRLKILGDFDEFSLVKYINIYSQAGPVNKKFHCNILFTSHSLWHSQWTSARILNDTLGYCPESLPDLYEGRSDVYSVLTAACNLTISTSYVLFFPEKYHIFALGLVSCTECSSRVITKSVAQLQLYWTYAVALTMCLKTFLSSQVNEASYSWLLCYTSEMHVRNWILFISYENKARAKIMLKRFSISLSRYRAASTDASLYVGQSLLLGILRISLSQSCLSQTIPQCIFSQLPITQCNFFPITS